MDTYHKKSIEDIKAMIDVDVMRQVVVDIEREIKSMEYSDDDETLENDPVKIFLNGNNIENPSGERRKKLISLLELRSATLNQMFRATNDEMALFVKVNDYLTKQTKFLTKRTADLYRSMLKCGRDLHFDDMFEVRGTMDICSLAQSPMPIDDYYGSDFKYMTELIRQMYYHIDDEPVLTCKLTTSKETVGEKEYEELVEVETHSFGARWDIPIFKYGRLAKPFDDIDVCDATRELHRYAGFSIPDLLHVEKVYTRSWVECQHLQGISHTDLLAEFNYFISKREETSMFYHIIAWGNAEDIYSVKLPVANAEVYLYATNTEAALLMIDNYSETELADEEPYNGESPLYFSEGSHRRSPVQFLYSIAKEWKENPALQNIKIGCFLLTYSTICNYEDMQEVWKNMGVTVREGVKMKIRNLIISHHETAISYLSDISEFVSKQRVYDMDLVVNDGTKDSLRGEDDEDDSEDDSPESSQSFEDEDTHEEELEFGAWLDDNDDISAPFSLGGNSDTHNDPPQARILNYIKDSRQQLDELVGLDDIKQHINDMLNLSLFNQKKLSLNPSAKLHEVNLHSIFCGPVGVGKTTVAQLYSSLLHDAGVLSKGHVVICDRGTFIGRLWGDEERRVAKVLEMARGGVLFIDEAYMLSTNNANDPGRIVLPSMLNLLADEKQRDIAVVLAGYEKPMENLLSLNPGLASRFVNRFHFKPFSVEELMEICQLKNAPYGYTFTTEATAAFKKMVEESYRQKGNSFSNGRFIANLLEKTYIRHATRCMTNGIFDEAMMTITHEDIPEEYHVEDDRGRMGFR